MPFIVKFKNGKYLGKSKYSAVDTMETARVFSGSGHASAAVNRFAYYGLDQVGGEAYVVEVHTVEVAVITKITAQKTAHGGAHTFTKTKLEVDRVEVEAKTFAVNASVAVAKDNAKKKTLARAAKDIAALDRIFGED